VAHAPTTGLRRAGPADAAALAAVGRATFVETFGHLYRPRDLADFLATSHSTARWAAYLAEPGLAVWVAAEAGGDIAGYVMAGGCKLPVPSADPRGGRQSGEVRQLYLRRRAQGRGLGTYLLVVALDWLRNAGRHPLYVGVWSGNFGAQRLYGRFGFTKVGEYDFPVGRHLDREFILRRPG
jgi:ribosomal protein S18 acetylase RimI-like enzyme